MKLVSIENASVIRKFSVVFTLVSLLPFLLLAALFFLFVFRGEIQLDSDLFFWAVFLIGLLSFIGFILMRTTLVNLSRVYRNAQDIAQGHLAKRIAVPETGNNEVSQLARIFNDVVQQLETNIKQLEKSRSMVQDVLLRVASGISSTEDIHAFLSLILETTVNALDGNAGLLLIFDEEKKTLVVESSCGLGKSFAPGRRIPLDDEVVGWAVKQKRSLLIPRVTTAGPSEAKDFAFEPPIISSPLIFQNKVLGAISVSGKKQAAHFTEDELVILSNLASQVALAIENARLSENSLKAYFETITALALAVEARDVYSRGHSDRVCGYAVKIAGPGSGLDEARVRIIKESAQLHDVGKIGISDDILRKPDHLNDVERDIMEQHPVIGEGIIVPLQGLAHLKDPVRHHHEWLDGTGYPDHLKGDQVSIEARILTVADSFDAMVTDRPYRKGMSIADAKAELIRYQGTRYDPAVVTALLGCVE